MKYTINNRPILLKVNDIVEFEVFDEKLEYHVRCNYLGTADNNNRKIFRLLFGDSDPSGYVSAIYGYTACSGHWPEYKEGDYAAATRLVNTLYEVIGRKNQALEPGPAPSGLNPMFEHGQEFSAKIEETIVTGRISIEKAGEGKIFLCQNSKDGNVASDMLGYRYSWTIGDGSHNALQRHDVSNLWLHPLNEEKSNKQSTITTKQSNNGQTINVPRTNPTIANGKRFRGSIISGGRSIIATAVGPKCYQKGAISC